MGQSLGSTPPHHISAGFVHQPRGFFNGTLISQKVPSGDEEWGLSQVTFHTVHIRSYTFQNVSYKQYAGKSKKIGHWCSVISRDKHEPLQKTVQKLEIQSIGFYSLGLVVAFVDCAYFILFYWLYFFLTRCRTDLTITYFQLMWISEHALPCVQNFRSTFFWP